MQGLGLAEPKVENKEVKDMGQVAQPKKMTWATIASQPAKPQPQVGSSSIKKKGPGMLCKYVFRSFKSRLFILANGKL